MHDDASRPRLRRGLDLLPSWIPGRPGIVIRDPYRYSDGLRLVPEALAPILLALDGQRSRSELTRTIARRLGVGSAAARLAPQIDKLVDALDEDGFLDGPRFEVMRAARHAAFAACSAREALHAGSGYPEAPDELRATLDAYLAAVPEPTQGPRAWRAIAAPHVSPFGGPHAYGAAYRELGPHLRDRTFVVLGTSHYGPRDKFGLTTKPFRTPLGDAPVDVAAVEALVTAAPDAVLREDYSHAIEHSIEFQVVFLQHRVAPDVRIIPILCGPLACASGERPEDADPAVAAFLRALGQLQSQRDDLTWILGIDLAHVGERYGHGFGASAGSGVMRDVEANDRARLERVQAGDADGFWELAHPADDDTHWCGTTPLYAFLRAVPQARGELLRYDQWNIDARSVVSFAGLAWV